MRVCSFCQASSCQGSQIDDTKPQLTRRHDDNSFLDTELEQEQGESQLHPYEEWVRQISESLRLLELQKDHSGIDGDFDGVSIVCFDRRDHHPTDNVGFRSVEIVQWAGKEMGVEGRIVKMDAENRLKCVVAVGASKVPIPFSSLNQEILWRDTGVKPVKAQWKRDQSRDRMPDHLVRLLAMFRTAEGGDDCGSAPANAASKPCHICNKVDRNQLPLTPPVRCCLCLLTFHQQCAKDLSEALKDKSGACASSEVGVSALSTLPCRLPSEFSWPRSFCQPRARQGLFGFVYAYVCYLLPKDHIYCYLPSTA